MIPVEAALGHVFDLVGPIGANLVPLREAAGRVLAAPVTARYDVPPFASSQMDGYAVAGEAEPGATFRVMGEAAAGHPWDGTLGPGQAIRIFTGAPVPPGAIRVVIQEDVARHDDVITIGDAPDAAAYIRPRGHDLSEGDRHYPHRPLTPADIALIAAMGQTHVCARRRPRVALIATGDELVMPGEVPGPGQIVASNHFGLAAMIERAGGIADMLPVARDTQAALDFAFDCARGADLIVTIGGASVGDHDLVARVAAARGMERRFYKVAMRPGKPLMAGRVDGTPMLGLPGNPVSAMVCGTVFLIPALRVMQGLPAAPAPRSRAPLAHDLGPNGPREHYMRGRRTDAGLEVFGRQDSALLSVLADADALVVRPPQDGPRRAGDMMDFIDWG